MLTRTNENKQGMEEVYGGLHVQRNRQSLKHANNQKCLISIVLRRSWDKSRSQKITTHGSKTLTAQYCLVLIFPGLSIPVRCGLCRQLLHSSLRRFHGMPGRHMRCEVSFHREWTL